jgi:DNA-binding FrmR family transcriptional regulator
MPATKPRKSVNDVKADHKEVKKLLNMAKGQIEGIQKMIEEDRYCLDVSNQILASIAILKKANQKVIKAHLETCVRETLDDEGGKKIAEIVGIIEKLG